MGNRTVLKIGHPGLRVSCEPVSFPFDQDTQTAADELLETLKWFRAQQGFGRAMAAPQVGFGKRMIAVAMPAWPSLIINPVITWKSEETFTLWDDCMSFPFMLVRVRRSESISLTFQDQNGLEHKRSKLDCAASELFQHEIDHLNGVLATDLALDHASLLSRTEFEANPSIYRAQVDYCIGD